MNLGTYLTRSAKFRPDSEAVVCGDSRLTYRELDDSTNRLASALMRTGLGIGDAVATFAGNCGGLVVTEMAVCKAGFVRVPVNARLGADELGHVLRDANVTTLFVDAAHADVALKVVADLGLDIAVYDYGNSAPGADRTPISSPTDSAIPSPPTSPKTRPPSSTTPPDPPKTQGRRADLRKPTRQHAQTLDEPDGRAHRDGPVPGPDRSRTPPG